MRIISISGKAQHGKDTVAGMMKNVMEDFGAKVLIVHYGDLVKYVSSKYLGWNGEKDAYGRSLLQRVGTELVRGKSPNYWVDFVKFMLSTLESEGKWDFVLIPDVRFPNEIMGTHVRVVRPNFDNGLTEEQKAHASETALDKWDYDMVIRNVSDKKHLKGLCTVAAMKLLGFKVEKGGFRYE